MRTLFFLVFFSALIVSKSIAQVKPDINLSEKDSIELENQLKQLLGTEEKLVSYFYASIGFGNRLYSVKNKALNANQSNAAVAVYSPSLSYFNKTGFGISAGANLLNDTKQFGVNQYFVSPSFDLVGNKNISLGISFTHYFVKDKYSTFSSSVQNDLFTSFSYKKAWLQPGIALGYSSGEYGEAKNKDSIIGGVKRHFYDTLNITSNSFYTMLSVQHQFEWYSIFNKLDGLSFSPSLMVNAGSGSASTTRLTNVPPPGPGGAEVFNALNRKGRAPRVQASEFQMQSIGLNLDLNYSIGNFNIEPQLYLDYYVRSTNTKRTTAIFMLNVGYTF
jgi:hypothetical protein